MGSVIDKWASIASAEGLAGAGPLREWGEPTAGYGPVPGRAVDVSVIVPTYDVEKYLRQAVTSALDNDEVDIDVIIVDDGSHDASLEIAMNLASLDPRVSVIHKGNGGYGSAVNRGLDAATGEYVAILEPDDWVEPHMYDRLFAMAKSAEAASGRPVDIMKSSYWRIVDPGLPTETRMHCSYYRRLSVRDGRPFVLADEPGLVRHHPSIWSALYRRGFLEANGIRMREVPGAGWVDNPWLYETMCRAESIVYTDEAWYCYREALPGSSSSGDVSMLSLERWNDMMDILEGLGIDDRGIRSSLHIVGFRYLQEILAKGHDSIPEVRAAYEAMLRRMDLSIVSGLDCVPPSVRRLAFDANGAEVPQMDGHAYRMVLAREFGKTIRTDGLGVAMMKVRKKLARR